jgi:TPR repeat protein/tRNA A-37 threonylcarbamoyl transferase component Bud32
MARLKKRRNLNALHPGYQLHWYEIREILGQGGFGITYLADDKNLDHEVAIKEYMPSDLTIRKADNSLQPISSDHDERFRWGLSSFIDEARTLGQFRHPNIVRVRNVFEFNNTAYMVMDYELGETLQDILNRRKILGEEDILTVMFPIIDGMKMIHAHGFIHRDIKPANIFIRVDGDPVLLDFGSARQALGESHGSITSIFSKGYAPIEQYNSKEDLQGPWTDIYALGATMYRAISGIPPCDAIDRSSAISITSQDTYVSALEIGEGRYSRALLKTIDYAMGFTREDRPQSITEWQSYYMKESSTDDVPATVPQEKPEDYLALELAKAEQGDVVAQSNLAFMYAKGINTERNDEEAARWYHLAAEQGHLNSQYNLGVIYAKGRGVEQDYSQAFKWYLKAAEQGDLNAQATVAMMYRKGIGTEKSYKDAYVLYKLAAQRGHINSMFNLGDMYAKGIGTKRDLQKAFQWYFKSAEKGHVNAQLNLGYMYGKGYGVERNDTEAYHWYRMAAESGHPNAQFNLGVIYAKGRGIPRNLEEARKWYQKAYDQGDANAKRSLERLE